MKTNYLLILLVLGSTAFADYREHVDAHQKVSNPKQWHILDWQVVQLVDGYALYAKTDPQRIDGLPRFIAVSLKSLSRIDRGFNIQDISQYSKSGGSCLKFQDEVTINDPQGFPMRGIRYSAVPCR